MGALNKIKAAEVVDVADVLDISRHGDTVNAHRSAELILT